MESKVVVPAEGQKITLQNGKLNVPNNPIIPFIEGDGIGVDVTPAMLKVVDAAVEKAYKGERKISWMEVYTGEKSTHVYGQDVWLPAETLDLIRDYRVAIKGPLTTPVGGGIRSLNVALRQTLDLYVCLRPVRWYKGVVSPVKEPQKVNMCVFRENTEDIYAGIEWEAGTPEAEKFYRFLHDEMGVTKVRFPETSSFGVKPVSVEGTERLVRAAIEFALANRLPSVTLVHKGNIMKFTEGGFKLWGYALAEREFPDKTFTWPQYEKIKKEKGEDAAATALLDAEAAGKVVIKDVIADAFLQNTLLVPEEYSVIATLNLNGDYVSDQLAAMVGGIGIAPGANIGDGVALFEATHGTAPKYAGQDKVNPGSIILSAEMMLRHMEWFEAADLIVKGMEGAINAKTVTYDFERLMEGAKLLKCSEFGDAIIANM